jgi:hypothetical protein
LFSSDINWARNEGGVYWKQAIMAYLTAEEEMHSDCWNQGLTEVPPGRSQTVFSKALQPASFHIWLAHPPPRGTQPP